MKSQIEIPWAKPYWGEEELQEVVRTVKSGWMSMGPRVNEFEEKLSELTSATYCVAVSSGTAALDIALKVLGAGPGDEVIVPAFTYIATATSVLYQGSTPVFCDVDPVTYTLDPEDVSRSITSKTKGIIAVDYAGQAPDYDALRSIAAES